VVLVDSSVWINFFNSKELSTPELDLALALGSVATTDLVLTEVLQGFRLNDKKRYQVAFEDLDACIYIPSFTKSISIKAANNYRLLRSKGITPRNTIDVYLATICIENNTPLLTYDLNDFVPMSKVLHLKMIQPKLND
jgi:predicted nucleic acid-binding protein